VYRHFAWLPKRGTTFALNNCMQSLKLKFLCLIVLLTAFPMSSAMAGKFNAVVNGKSYHINSTYDWNENNFGAGLEYEFHSESKWKKIAMMNAFRDSNNKMSYMAGAGLHRELIYSDRFSGFYILAGINVFIMTREDVQSNRPFPGLLPSLTIGNQSMGLNFTYLPKAAVQSMTNVRMMDPTISGILFMQFKVSLDKLLP